LFSPIPSLIFIPKQYLAPRNQIHPEIPSGEIVPIHIKFITKIPTHYSRKILPEAKGFNVPCIMPIDFTHQFLPGLAYTRTGSSFSMIYLPHCGIRKTSTMIPVAAGTTG
jgi:hypothetical protein